MDKVIFTLKRLIIATVYAVVILSGVGLLSIVALGIVSGPQYFILFVLAIFAFVKKDTF